MIDLFAANGHINYAKISIFICSWHISYQLIILGCINALLNKDFVLIAEVAGTGQDYEQT